MCATASATLSTTRMPGCSSGTPCRSPSHRRACRESWRRHGCPAAAPRGSARSGAVCHQSSCRQGQEIGGHGAVYQQYLLGVAHGGTAGLGVLHDGQRLIQIGGLVHVDVADAGAGLDAGTVAPFSTQARISPAPPRGISRSTTPVRRHQTSGALVTGILQNIHDVRVAAGGGDARFSAFTMAVAVRVGLLPLRRTQTLPLLTASAAASEVTLGRLS